MDVEAVRTKLMMMQADLRYALEALGPGTIPPPAPAPPQPPLDPYTDPRYRHAGVSPLDGHSYFAAEAGAPVPEGFVDLCPLHDGRRLYAPSNWQTDTRRTAVAVQGAYSANYPWITWELVVVPAGRLPVVQYAGPLPIQLQRPSPDHIYVGRIGNAQAPVFAPLGLTGEQIAGFLRAMGGGVWERA